MLVESSQTHTRMEIFSNSINYKMLIKNKKRIFLWFEIEKKRSLWVFFISVPQCLFFKILSFHRCLNNSTSDLKRHISSAAKWISRLTFSRTQMKTQSEARPKTENRWLLFWKFTDGDAKEFRNVNAYRAKLCLVLRAASTLFSNVFSIKSFQFKRNINLEGDYLNYHAAIIYHY